MTSPRVRFAPSPTGKLHIGGARTALFNWAFARRHGGAFLLRIEDTDRERSTPENEVAILEGLRWLGIDWDEGPDVGGDRGPYRQTERFETYAPVAARLLRAGHAYRSFQPPAELEALRAQQEAAGERPPFRGSDRDQDPAESQTRADAGEPFTLRFRVPDGRTSFHDLVRGDVSFPNDDVDDWIMVRTDGTPTYNFVVVCDDVAMGITHVMRGEEHLTNTPKQVLLYKALEEEPPQFAHFPLMLGTDGKKLSKRTGDTALQDYREKGYPPEAVLNFLSLQGWALDDKTDVFSTRQLVENFDPADVSKAGAIFDPEKFLWMAGEYVHTEPLARLAERGAPHMVAAGLMSADEIVARAEWFERAVATAQERMRLYTELPAQLAYLFASDEAVDYDEKAVKNSQKHAEPTTTLATYREWLAPRLNAGSSSAVDADALREATRDWVKEQGLKFPQLFQPLRCALTGKAGGPDLFDVMALLGPERTLRRIDVGLERLGG